MLPALARTILGHRRAAILVASKLSFRVYLPYLYLRRPIHASQGNLKIPEDNCKTVDVQLYLDYERYLTAGLSFTGDWLLLSRLDIGFSTRQTSALDLQDPGLLSYNLSPTEDPVDESAAQDVVTMFEVILLDRHWRRNGASRLDTEA